MSESEERTNAELAEFLRRVSTLGGMVQCGWAADRIEQQAARIAELEAALRNIVFHFEAGGTLARRSAAVQIALKALSSTPVQSR